MSGTNDPDEEQDRDDVLEDTFPASDPPSHGGSTGPNEPPRPGQTPEDHAASPRT